MPTNHMALAFVKRSHKHKTYCLPLHNFMVMMDTFTPVLLAFTTVQCITRQMLPFLMRFSTFHSCHLVMGELPLLEVMFPQTRLIHWHATGVLALESFECLLFQLDIAKVLIIWEFQILWWPLKWVRKLENKN